MKKLILSFAAFAALVSCTKENMPDNSQSAESFAITLQATAPGASDDTKTTLVDHSLVHWTKGDAIKVGFGALSNSVVTVNKIGIFTSTFTDETSATAFFSIDSWDWIRSGSTVDESAFADNGLAMYPSTVSFDSKRINGWSNLTSIIQYTLPSEQIAVENSFEPGICFSTANVNKADFNANKAQLSFKNECALIKIVLPEGVDDVVSVNVTSMDETAVTGKFYYNKQETPLFPISFEITDGVASANLNAPENETLTAGAAYYMVVCPGTHSSGLMFKFTNTEGLTCTKKVEKEIILEKSKIDEFKFKTITYEEKLDYNDTKVGDYFYADGTFSSEPVPGMNPVGIVFYVANGADANKPTVIDSKLAEACAELGTDVGAHGLVVACNYKTINPQFNSYRASWSTSGGVTENSSTGAINDITSAGETMTGYADTKIVKDYFSQYTITQENCISYVSGLARVTNASPWYLPSVAECTEISKVIGTINDKLDAAERSSLPGSGYYCGTVSQVSNYTSCYVVYDLNVTDADRTNYSSYMKEVKKNAITININNMNVYTLPIFAF